MFRSTCESDRRRGINRFRWVEYSISATLTVLLIGFYSGVDTSALIAILSDESSTSAHEAIANDPRRLLSGVSLLEATLVIEARHGDTSAESSTCSSTVPPSPLST